MFSKKFNNFSKIFSNIFLSRITGLIRDILFANFLGATMISDAFMFAFRLPNLFRRILSEGAMTSVFIPLYSEIKKNDKVLSLKFSSAIFLLFFIITLILSVISLIYANQITLFLAPGFQTSPDIFLHSVFLVRIIFPFLIFVTLSAFFSAILNANNIFFLPSFVSALLNIGMIMAMIFYKSESTVPLSISIIIVGFIQTILLFINFKVAKLYFIFTFTISKELICVLKKFFLSFLQSLIGAGIVQLNIFISMIFGSLVGAGAITQIYYADRIIDLPFALIAVCLSITLLPYLSSNIGDNEKFSFSINKSLIFCNIFAFPCIVALYLLSPEIVNILFGRGAFTDNDVINTSSVIVIYSFSLPGYMVSRIVNQIFYSYQKIHLSILASIPTFILNFILCYLLYSDYGVQGLALSSVLSVYLNVFFQIIFLNIYISDIYRLINFINFFKNLKIIFSSFFIGLVILFLSQFVFFNEIFHLLITISISLLLYFVLLNILKIDEFKILYKKMNFN